VVLPNNLIVFEGTAPQTFVIANPAAPTLANINNSNTSTGGLTVNGNLQLSGNLIGSGLTTFTDGSNLIMESSLAQTLGGSGRLNLSGLTITNAAGVTLGAGAKVDVRRFLKINPSSLFTVTPGTLTFLASASTQANLLKVEGTIVGNVIYQKKLPNVPAGGWFFLSPIVQNQPVNSFAQRGNQYSPQTTYGLYDGGSFFSYDKFFTTFPQANGWKKPASLTDIMNQTQGYRVYVNKTFFGQGGLFVFQGAPVVGSLSFPVSYCNSNCAYPDAGGNNGWSLVGNPYMCTIDWNAPVGWTKTNISPAIYIWNAEQNTYSTWDGIAGTFGGSRYIAPGQSFFVEATSAAPVLSANEDVKVNLNNLGLREAVDNYPTICKVRVEQGSQADEANVYFSDDLQNFKNRKFSQSGLKLAVEGKFVSAGYALNESGWIPLEVSGARAGNVTIILNLQEAQTSVNVFLLDTEENKLYPLVTGENKFEFTVNDPSTTAGRWVLQNQSSVVHTSDMITRNSLTVYPNPARQMLYLSETNIEATQYQINTISGREIQSQTLENNRINISTLQPGVYLLTVIMKDGSSRNLKFIKE
jgi:hypothetical protein